MVFVYLNHNPCREAWVWNVKQCLWELDNSSAFHMQKVWLVKNPVEHIEWPLKPLVEKHDWEEEFFCLDYCLPMLLIALPEIILPWNHRLCLALTYSESTPLQHLQCIWLLITTRGERQLDLLSSQAGGHFFSCSPTFLTLPDIDLPYFALNVSLKIPLQ